MENNAVVVGSVVGTNSPPNGASSAEGSHCDKALVERLNKRIANLTEILQQTTKASFNLFMRKASDKQRKYNELKKSYEQCVSAFDGEKKKLEERCAGAAQRVGEAESRVASLAAENKKLLCLRDNMKEQLKALKDEIDNLQKEAKAKVRAFNGMGWVYWGVGFMWLDLCGWIYGVGVDWVLDLWGVYFGIYPSPYDYILTSLSLVY